MHPTRRVVRTWVSERTSDLSTRSVRAHRVETGPFEYTKIFWEYRQTPEGVHMRWVQDFHVRDELPFGDEEMAEHLTADTLAQMRAVKERIEAAAGA
ncbi:hypothetical protein PUR71_25335 [Streptomyces sp. SP17BM10]|uniref:hypothetical protein n=1 Tax=Streptomyces sp. SP17BM10 TaxID=3002530 RepID=UPI002E78E7B5|nr:hypothetical protein [Streptomyces sp. SP17BM10]MEE1786197.1 hypothetical protein [Streptomyces sp. SP17BM10]